MIYLIAIIILIIAFLIWFFFGTDDGEQSIWQNWMTLRELDKRIKLQKIELEKAHNDKN